MNQPKWFFIIATTAATACGGSTGNELASTAASTSVAVVFQELKAEAQAFDIATYRRQSPLAAFDKALSKASDAKVEIGPYLWRGTRSYMATQRVDAEHLSALYPTMGAYLDAQKIDPQASFASLSRFEANLKDIQAAMDQSQLALDNADPANLATNISCHNNQWDAARQTGCVPGSTGSKPNLDASALACLFRHTTKMPEDCNAKYPVPTVITVTNECSGNARCANGPQNNGGINFVRPAPAQTPATAPAATPPANTAGT